MTAGDAYIIVMRLAVVLTIAVACGWAVDRWPEWTHRARAHRNAAHLRWVAVAANAYGRRGTITEPHGDPSPDPRRTRQHEGTTTP